MGVDGAYVPVRAPGVVAVDAEGEALLVDEVTGGMHLLNPSGALLWECFDGSGALEEICADIAAELAVPFTVVLDDAVALVDRLRDVHLLDDAERDVDPAPADVPPRPRLLDEPPSG